MADHDLTPLLIRKKHALATPEADLLGMRVELLNRMKLLEDSDPGATHPAISDLNDAVNAIDKLRSGEAKTGASLTRLPSADVTVPPPTTPAVVEQTKARPQPVPPAAAREAVRRNVEPVQRRRRARSIGLASLGALIVAIVALSGDVANNSLLATTSPYTNEEGIRPAYLTVWTAGCLLLLAGYLYVRHKEDQIIRFLETVHDFDEQIDAARDYFEQSEFADGVILFPQEFDNWLFRRASDEFPSSDADILYRSKMSVEAKSAAMRARDKAITKAVASLSSEMRSGLQDAREEAIFRWVELGWLELADVPFSRGYIVVGELDL